MFIGFLLGSPEINGGTYVIYEHGSRLKKQGHRVAMITREVVKPEQHAWHPAAAELEWITLEQACLLSFDFVVATWWQSAFMLHKFSAMHAVYFVQSIESRFFDAEDAANHDRRDNDLWRLLCESTYSFAIPKITEARWIRNYLYEHFNSDAYLVPNGIRKDIYCPDGRCEAPRPGDHLRVLIEGPVEVSYKNVPKSVELCRRAGVKEVWLMTSSQIETFPGVDRVFSRVPISKTAEIYRSCDLLLKLSYVEGMFGPPLEMFHCGGTAIVYEVTGADEYIVHERNGYIAERDDEEAVVGFLRHLQDDPLRLEKLKEEAALTAGQWPDWQQSTERFEKALLDIRENCKKVSRRYLDRHTRFLLGANQSRLSEKRMAQFSARELGPEGNGDEGHDFVQVYWHSGEGFKPGNFQWRCYTPGNWERVFFQIEVPSTPMYLRIDPSVRIGIILIREISVTNAGGEKIFVHLKKWSDWRKVDIGGTAVFLQRRPFPVIESVGEDPQLFLPVIDHCTPGEDLRIQITLMEMGFRESIRKNRLPAGGSFRRLAGSLVK